MSFSFQIKPCKKHSIKHILHRIQSNLICITHYWRILSTISVLQLRTEYGKLIYVFLYSKCSCNTRILDSCSCNSRSKWSHLNDSTKQSQGKVWNQIFHTFISFTSFSACVARFRAISLALWRGAGLPERSCNHVSVCTSKDIPENHPFAFQRDFNNQQQACCYYST